MPDYFRKFDSEFRYVYHDIEYDERALRNANRFEHQFTLKIPYKLTPKISIFPEYTYGFFEYDSQSGLSDPSSDSHYNEIYAGMIIVIALTTVFPPLVMKWLYDRYSHRLNWLHSRIEPIN